jgi:hypothetical protein
MEKINVYPAAGASSCEVIVREGSAPKVVEPIVLKTEGTLRSIGEFLGKRKTHPGAGQQEVDPSKTVVKVDRTNREIVLYLNPTNPLGTVITGRLELSDELKPFHINEEKYFTRKDLIKLLRFNRALFNDLDKHTELLAAYQAFQAKAKSDMGAEDDTRGNKKFAFQKEVKSNIPESFVLNAPIFKGEKAVAFRVEICLEVTDAGGAEFWFESVEMKELHDEQRDELIKEQLEFCSDFPILEK